jgi:hypothetical protein
MWTLLRRIRAAAAVLFLPGDRMPVTRHDLLRLHHEWAEWEITFNGILEKLNAWQARQAKREKRALERSLGEDNSEGLQQPTGRVHKLDLYRRARAVGGGTPPPPPNPQGTFLPDDDGDDEP